MPRPVLADSELANSNADPHRRTLQRLAAGALALLVVYQLAFLLFGCSWDLSNDEAYYWDWSRHLDVGYTKGPLVAWLIRLSTMLTGRLAVALTGTMMPAIRLPAVLLGALTSWGVYRLGTLVGPRTRVGVWALLLMPAVPIFAAGSVLMTDDTSFVCCWTWAAVWAYRGASRDDLRAWALAGACGVLGVLAKYTMLAFPASVGLYLLLEPARRRQLLRPGFWVMSCGCVLGMVPLLVWNASHGWVGIGHLAGRIGLVRSSWTSLGPLLRMIGGEVAVLGGTWWLLGIDAGARAARRAFAGASASQGSDATAPPEREGLRYLLCLWAVVWSACALASFRGVTQPNWLAPVYIPLVVLVAWRIDSLMEPRERAGRFAPSRWRWGYVGCWAAGLVAMLVMEHSDWLYPALRPWLPSAANAQRLQIRRIDATCRMRGYHELAPEVERRLAALRAEGLDPFLLTPEYGVASSLSFYLPDQPAAWCLGGPAGVSTGVGAQHDLWRPNPRLDPDVYAGRPALVVEPANAPLPFAAWLAQVGLFDQAEATEQILVRQRGLVVAAWNITLCRQYRGLAALDDLRAEVAQLADDRHYVKLGGTDPSYVAGLYREIFGRDPSPAEQLGWVRLLREIPRYKLAETLLTTGEHRQRLQARTRSSSDPNGEAIRQARRTTGREGRERE